MQTNIRKNHPVHVCLQTGRFGDSDANEGANDGSMDNVKEAVSAVRSSGSSWFGLAVLSGKVEAVLWVYRFIAQHYPGKASQAPVHYLPVRRSIATVVETYRSNASCCWQASRTGFLGMRNQRRIPSNIDSASERET